MILSTHAVVGGAIASLIPAHPVLAVIAGFASHFAIDAIPHWDYPLCSISAGKDADNRRLRLSRGLLLDLFLIGTDGCIGLALTVWLFAAPATAWTIVLGATAGMLPDALQLAYSLYPREPLVAFQRLHGWIHSKQKLGWRLGASSQFALGAVVSTVAFALA